MANETQPSKPEKAGFLGKLLKIQNVKPLLIILALLVVAIMVLNISSSKKTTDVSGTASNSSYTTSLDYIAKLETKLKGVIGQIKGAGKTKVMISISSSPELEVANNVEEKTVTTSSGTTTTVSTEPIIVRQSGTDSPLILKETLPNITGVVVVSAGARDIKVKLDILLAVTTALGIDGNIVEVFVGN